MEVRAIQIHPADPSRYLLVTVDTEEEGLWGGQYRRDGNTVRNVIEGVPRFQELCDQLELKPVYLIDYPVVEDERAAALLQQFAAADRCEIGAHLHPWCNPPHGAYQFPRDSYLMNLPDELQRAKLQQLTEAIEQRFGRRPRSFRAGRYGLDVRGARLLAELGYRVDSSVIAFSSFTADGGPDFTDAPWQPYWVRTAEASSLLEPAEEGDLLEVPVSVGYSRARFGWRHRLRRRLERSWLRRVKVVGVVDRLGIARRVKFSPEQADAAAMLAFVEAAVAQGAWCLVMMFHSSSLVAGFSPYVRDKKDLREFFARIREVLQGCRALGFRTVTFQEVWRKLAPQRSVAE